MNSSLKTLAAICICLTVKSQVIAQLPNPLVERNTSTNQISNELSDSSMDLIIYRLEQAMLNKIYTDCLTSELSRNFHKISPNQFKEIKALQDTPLNSQEFIDKVKRTFTAEQLTSYKRLYLSRFASLPLDIFTEECFSKLQIPVPLRVDPIAIAKYRAQLEADLKSRRLAWLVDYAQHAPDDKREQIWNYFGVDFTPGTSDLPPEKLLLLKPQYAFQFLGFITSIARKEKLLVDEEHIQNIGELYKLYGSVRDEKSNDDWVYSDALDDMSNEAKVKAIQLYQQHQLSEDLRILLAPQLLNAMNFSKAAVLELKKKVPQWHHEHQQARTDSELKLAKELLKAQPDNVQKLLVKIFEDVWDLGSPK